MGLRPLRENAVVAEHGSCFDKWCNVAMWDMKESPFSYCVQHRAHLGHVFLHLVVPQRPCGLLSVEAVQFKGNMISRRDKLIC